MEYTYIKSKLLEYTTAAEKAHFHYVVARNWTFLSQHHGHHPSATEIICALDNITSFQRKIMDLQDLFWRELCDLQHKLNSAPRGLDFPGLKLLKGRVDDLEYFRRNHFQQ